MRYQIQGDTLPVVICQLEAGERMITEGGGMSWMSPNMKRKNAQKIGEETMDNSLFLRWRRNVC